MPSLSSIFCFNCGYSLEGLSHDALCPECSFSITESLAAFDKLGTRAALPLWLLGLFQLGASLWLLTFAIVQLLDGARLSGQSTIALLVAGPLLWLVIQCLWCFIAAVFASTLAPRSSPVIIGCSAVNLLALLVAGVIALNLLVGGLDFATAVILPIALFVISVLATLVGSIAAATAMKRLVVTLPSALRTDLALFNRLTMYLAFVSAAGMFLLYFVSPWFGLLMPLAPGFSAIRSFTFSDRIRAAIGDH